MAKVLRTEIIIQASPEKVWSVLTDFDSYPEWNPFIRNLNGKVEVGGSLSVLLAPPDTKAMAIKPVVQSLEENREFSWMGHLLFKGLFDGRHKFELQDNGDGTTTFIHSEQFAGILVPLFKKLLDDNTHRGFVAMNEALKKRVETRVD